LDCQLDSDGVSNHVREVSDITYKLEELARAANISPRTVRYYVQRGLVPPPAFRGKDSSYGPEHLVRLKAIRRLQEAFFPLDAIMVELERRSIDEIEAIGERGAIPVRVQDAHAPELPARSVGGEPGSRATRSFSRIELAPGLELNVADDAPRESQIMAEDILRRLGKRT
jgi:DNA-binding transcriptional MerR regulator